MKARFLTVLLGFAVAVAVPLTCSATSSVSLAINGVASVGATTIDFGVEPVGAPYASPGSYGTFQVGGPPSGVFAANGVVAGEFGMIQSLDSGAFPPSTAFMTFSGPPPAGAGGTGLSLFVTGVTPQTLGPGCVNNPFSGGDILLCNSPSGATATLDLTGTLKGDTTNPGGTDNWSGIFNANFAGITVAQLLAPGGLPANSTYAATFTVTTSPSVPEPATFLLMGLGLVGAGLVVRRKARN